MQTQTQAQSRTVARSPAAESWKKKSFGWWYLAVLQGKDFPAHVQKSPARIEPSFEQSRRAIPTKKEKASNGLIR